MKVVGAIPARWGSTRLPGKSLIPIAGKPLIQWVIESARKASCLGELLVATDDRRIRDFVAGLGVRAVMTSSIHQSGADRIAEAVRDLGADVVINIQGDEPVIEQGLIDRLAEATAPGRAWDMATAAVPIENPADLSDPSVVKVVCGEDGRALYFSRSVIPFVRDPGSIACDRAHWRHLGIYAYKAAFLEKLVRAPQSLPERLEKLEQLRALHIGARIAVLPTHERSVGVDTPADVASVERIICQLHGI
ncbi:MAG: 3-deoxy-manno-octulosonate cytidylyltransferase [Verrucomicrobiota bacterium]|nr:3-deoxy-manno-octulosonate cytidylyltransferase [Verrucomicrobiota bacterium]